MLLLTSNEPKYAMRQSSLITVTQSIIKLLISLEDTRVILISSNNQDLTPVKICPDIANNIRLSRYSAAESNEQDKWRINQSYLRFGQTDLKGNKAYSKNKLAVKDEWFSCSFNRRSLEISKAFTDRENAADLIIMGLGDRFNILLKAYKSSRTRTPQQTADIFQIELIFEPEYLAAFSNNIQHKLLQNPETLASFHQAINGWFAAPNQPSVQSEFTLKMLSALEHNCLEEEPTLAEKNFSWRSSGQQLVKPEQLLHKLLGIEQSSSCPQVMLQQSSALIRETFNVSKCLIAFYSVKDNRVIEGAIAYDPEIPNHERASRYPEWKKVEYYLEHEQNMSWATESCLSKGNIQSKIASDSAQSFLLTWLHPTPNQQIKTEFYGLLMVEQWEQHRIWQTEEKELLYLALHQIHQSLEQANLYQQAEEQIANEALLNRLTGKIRASLDLSHIFETVTVELGTLLVADSCLILQYFEEDKSWKKLTDYFTNSDLKSSIEPIIADKNNNLLTALHNLEIVQVSDTHKIGLLEEQAVNGKYPRAWLMVPIYHQDKIWGCLTFAQEEYPRYWCDSELKLVTNAANQLAIAIEQATLYQKIQQHNYTLEAIVLERTAELESFFDAHPDYIFVVERQETANNQERDLCLRFCNHAFANSMGFENRYSMQNRSIKECFPEAIANSFIEQNWLVFESGETIHEQEALTLADGIHYFDTFRVPLKHPDGETYACLGTWRDITELIQTKQALSDRTEQLQDTLTAAHAANRAKSNFLSTMSHELRTPLTAVIGMSSALLQQYFGDLNPKQTEYLKIIHNSGEHLLQLINDILDLSKIEAGKTTLQITQFSLHKIAKNCLELLAQKAQVHKIKLISEIDIIPEFDNFYGDERRAKQILLNLLSNAVKFTPAGGQVCLAVQSDGNAAIIEVSDTGIGIPPEKQEVVFEVFGQIDSSLSRQHEGTGLGLALTRQLVEMHGGTITFNSTVGVGTIFTVYLPAQTPTKPNFLKD